MESGSKVNEKVLVPLVCDWYKSPKNKAKTTFSFNPRPVASYYAGGLWHRIVVYLVEKYTEVTTYRTTPSGRFDKYTILVIEPMTITSEGNVTGVDEKYMKIADNLRKGLMPPHEQKGEDVKFKPASDVSSLKRWKP